MVNLLIGTHLSSHKLSLGSSPTFSPKPVAVSTSSNPKGGINAVQVEIDNEGEDEAEDEEGENNWLYELLKILANSDESDYEEEDENIEEESEEESDKEEEESELAEEKDREKGKIFFIDTLFKEKKSEEEIPIKCEDPVPCLVTSKIRGVSISDCLCDPGAGRNIMPFEVYELLDLGPLKKSREVFITADASIVSVIGIAEDVLVMI
ncbi:hypothetical protein PIB30_085509 [Stylosanthes scabra]|uniref:Uncharacterized protein n=1 Tax=Stylosanthes scabra TaxID=79078 RepID=A0ABU6ZRF2_9FABA|nr:hypothetical protein [Stylosanthes scabra]